MNREKSAGQPEILLSDNEQVWVKRGSYHFDPDGSTWLRMVLSDQANISGAEVPKYLDEHHRNVDWNRALKEFQFDPESLSRVLKGAYTWALSAEAWSHDYSTIYRGIFDPKVVFTSLCIAIANPTLYANPGKKSADSFYHGMVHQSTKKLRTSLLATRFVNDTAQVAVEATDTRKVFNREIVEMEPVGMIIDILRAAGVVEKTFWYKYAVRELSEYTDFRIIEEFYKRIETDTYGRKLLSKSESARYYDDLFRFATRIFDVYQQDPDRHVKNIAAIKELISRANIVDDKSVGALTGVMDASNSISKLLNKQAKEEYRALAGKENEPPEDLLLDELDASSINDLPAAILRLLSITRNKNDPEQFEKQAAQDAIVADLVAYLVANATQEHSRQYVERSLKRAELKLLMPDADDREIRSVQNREMRPKILRKQWDRWRPGYGYLT